MLTKKAEYQEICPASKVTKNKRSSLGINMWSAFCGSELGKCVSCVVMECKQARYKD